MNGFIFRFLVCNAIISLIIGMLLAAKSLLKNCLTSRMQYHLWFLLLGLLAVPFLPLPSALPAPFFSWFGKWQYAAFSSPGNIPAFSPSDTAGWMNDFGITVSHRMPSGAGRLLSAFWSAGVFGTLMLVFKSTFRFHMIKKSALPLQNPSVRRLYHDCVKEMGLAKPLPIYSTAFLKSPVMTGLFRPCIYLPIHLISDYNKKDIRYMLLHELQHYRHKDALAVFFMNIAGILYWFNPLVWRALKEMKDDREVACDTSVLKMLDTDAYEDYGNTLINFAEKVSLMPFPFAAGIGGNMVQIQKRILNIASYHPDAPVKKLRGCIAFALITVLLTGFVPVLSIKGASPDHYFFQEQGKNITYIDLDASFGGYEGSFVLYDTARDAWQIYNMENARTRIAPVSTYKIYDALLGLESGIISPDQSFIPWDGQIYPYEQWNTGQTLESAMKNSVTWYFQAIDCQSSLADVKAFIREIGYGSQDICEDLSSYWLDSSLKISPIEQIEVLEKFYYNQFGFSPENINAVKCAIRLSDSGAGTVFGKTGTQEAGGKNISGWFIGYIEKEDGPCFFATNIQSESAASGPAAAALTFSILSDLGF